MVHSLCFVSVWEDFMVRFFSAGIGRISRSAPEMSLGINLYRVLIIRLRSADLWVLVVLFACVLSTH